MQAHLTAGDRLKNDFRCRIRPVSIGKRGLCARGRLWSRSHIFDFPNLIRDFKIQDLGSFERSDCHQGCLAAAARIIKGPASTEGSMADCLAYCALRLSETRRMTGPYSAIKEDKKISAIPQGFWTYKVIFSGSYDRMLLAHLEELFPNPGPDGSAKCHLWRLLQSGRMRVYAPESYAERYNGPVIIWYDALKQAPQAMFVPSRVLMDGEVDPELLLVWTVQRRKNDRMGELVLDDYLPRRISAEPTEFFSRTTVLQSHINK